MASGSIGDGRKVVTTAGTRVQLAASGACRWVIVNALPANTNEIVVGGATVVAAEGTRRGLALAPGVKSEPLDANELSDIWLDAETNGEGVSFIYGID